MNGNTTAVLQKLLYDHPLFEAMSAGEGVMRILVIGFGETAPGFVDLCLELGQMKDHEIRVTVLTANPERDRNRYLEERPELPRFFNVNGETAEYPDQAYGTLNFCPIAREEKAGGVGGTRPEGTAGDGAGAGQARPGGDGAADGDVTLLDILKGRTSFNYIFLDMPESSRPRHLAEQIAKWHSTRSPHAKCPVCYVTEEIWDDPGTEAETEGLYPVRVNRAVSLRDIDPELERMAFNTHLCWSSSMNLDLDRLREEFLKDYNYTSSVSNVLSITYKLFSVGIVRARDLPHLSEVSEDLLVADSDRAAARLFREQILDKRETDPAAAAKFRTMAALEHRRWNVSLLTKGWRAPRDAEGRLNLDQYVKDCLQQGRAKDEEHHVHHCLVYGREDTPLQTPAYRENGHARWEDRGCDEALDDLDWMSVELHRRFREEAEKLREDPEEIYAELDRTQQLVGPTNAYRVYELCVRNLLAGSESSARQYDSAESALLDSFPASVPQREETERHIAAVRRFTFSLRESDQYRDYKANDDLLIEQIPFILTWRRPSLTLAFEDGRLSGGRNEAVFANVAAATVLCPSELHYCYCCDRHSDIDLLRSKITAVLNYLGRRRVRCSVRFTVVLILGDFSARKAKEQHSRLISVFNRLLTEYRGKPIAPFAKFSILEAQDEEAAAAMLCGRLQQEFSADTGADTQSGGEQRAAEAAAAQIETAEEIRRETSLQLFDGSTHLFSSAMANANFLQALDALRIPYCEFDWRRKRFTRTVRCEYLRYIRDNSSIRIDDMFALMNAANLGFRFPDRVGDLKKAWNLYSGHYPEGRNVPFDQGVANWAAMCTVLQDKENNVSGTDGMVKKLEGDILKRNRLWDLLRGLEAAGYLEILSAAQFDDNVPLNVRLRFASSESRTMMTQHGEILEKYAYYRTLETGYFDDAASSYNFAWENEAVTNELDLVLTKGFRSMLVECKAVKNQKEEYYYKLHSISQQCGIGMVVVMLGNQYGNSDQTTAENNEEQRIRGELLHIHTITGEENIRNIGVTLMKLMQEVCGEDPEAEGGEPVDCEVSSVPPQEQADTAPAPAQMSPADRADSEYAEHAAQPAVPTGVPEEDRPEMDSAALESESEQESVQPTAQPSAVLARAQEELSEWKKRRPAEKDTKETEKDPEDIPLIAVPTPAEERLFRALGFVDEQESIFPGAGPGGQSFSVEAAVNVEEMDPELAKSKRKPAIVSAEKSLLSAIAAAAGEGWLRPEELLKRFRAAGPLRPGDKKMPDRAAKLADQMAEMFCERDAMGSAGEFALFMNYPYTIRGKALMLAWNDLETVLAG